MEMFGIYCGGELHHRHPTCALRFRFPHFQFGSSLFTAAVIIEYERNRFNIKKMFSDFTTVFNTGNQSIRLSDGQKWGLAVIALNTLVFCFWKIPAVERFMWQFFTNSYASSLFPLAPPPSIASWNGFQEACVPRCCWVFSLITVSFTSP